MKLEDEPDPQADRIPIRRAQLEDDDANANNVSSGDQFCLPLQKPGETTYKGVENS